MAWDDLMCPNDLLPPCYIQKPQLTNSNFVSILSEKYDEKMTQIHLKKHPQTRTQIIMLISCQFHLISSLLIVLLPQFSTPTYGDGVKHIEPRTHPPSSGWASLTLGQTLTLRWN